MKGFFNLIHEIFVNWVNIYYYEKNMFNSQGRSPRCPVCGKNPIENFELFNSLFWMNGERFAQCSCGHYGKLKDTQYIILLEEDRKKGNTFPNPNKENKKCICNFRDCKEFRDRKQHGMNI